MTSISPESAQSRNTRCVSCGRIGVSSLCPSPSGSLPDGRRMFAEKETKLKICKEVSLTTSRRSFSN